MMLRPPVWTPAGGSKMRIIEFNAGFRVRVRYVIKTQE